MQFLAAQGISWEIGGSQSTKPCGEANNLKSNSL